MNIQIKDQILVQQIEQIATTEHRTPEQIVTDALRFYLAQEHKTSGVSFLLSIVGQGHSGQTDVSMRDEEILAKEIDPIRGWHPESPDADTA